MADVGGTLAFDDVVLGLELPGKLPAFVPQVDGGDLAELDAGLEWPAYALGLRRVISPKTLRVYPPFAGRSAAEGMGLRPGQLAVLVGYGLDPLVEAVWTKKASLLPELARQRWDLVLAPNYSMYQVPGPARSTFSTSVATSSWPPSSRTWGSRRCPTSTGSARRTSTATSSGWPT